MGDLFERLTQLYLQTHPTYRSKIKTVWWCNNDELPEEVRRKLNLPETDEGIDLLCETYDGEYWSVQSKYQTNSDLPLNYKKLSTFLSLSFVMAKGISTGLVVHTSTKKVKKSHLMGNTVELGLQHWLDITDGQWDQILDVCRGNLLKPPQKRTKRKHQKLAIEKAKEHFLEKGYNRGKLIMPCGTGKSLIAYWSTKVLGAKTVIVAVPALALVKQSLQDWTTEYLAEDVHPEWMAVCSDDSVGKMREADSTVATVYEAGIPTTTDPTEIVNFIRKKSKNPKVIFTTYQSSPKLADACKQEGLTIDLLIADEAHKTVGRKDKKFATLLSDENIKIKQRMFMTATERVYRQGSENIASMDDESVYGKIFHQMSFKQAIDDEVICDYKILTVAVSGSKVANLMAEHTNVIAQLGNQKVETDAHNLAAGMAIEKVFEKHKIKHALSFHRSIKRAENFCEQQDAFSGKLGSKLLIENRNISSKLSAGKRSQLLTDFMASERSLISNARCLTEGVDIPSIDCVAFVDPKKSTVDIVQAAGRAMRQSKETGKTHGYLLLPIIVPNGQELDQFTESTDFASVARVITSLSTQDERIVDELRHREPGQPPNPDDIIIIDPEIIEALDVDYEHFYDAINTRIWASVGKANWRPFEEARKLVHGLGINSSEWRDFAKTKKKPADIPADPAQAYATEWTDWRDFLGAPSEKEEMEQYIREYKSYAKGKLIPFPKDEFVTKSGFKLGNKMRSMRTSNLNNQLPEWKRKLIENELIAKGLYDWDGRDVFSWKKHFEAYRKFRRTTGRDTPSKNDNINGLSIDTWFHTQKTKYKKYKGEKTKKVRALEKWQLELLESVNFPFGSNLDRNWKINYEKYKSIYEKHKGRIPNKMKSASIWISKQRQRYKKGTMPQDRIEFLEKIKYWKWDVFGEQFEDKLQMLEEFYQATKDSNPKQDTMYNDFKVGQFLTLLREKFRENELEDNVIKRIEKLGIKLNPSKKVGNAVYYD